jgi:hypothetical protein
MTDDQKDKQVGRVLRRWNEAETELNHLLVQERTIAEELKKLSDAVSSRVASQLIARDHTLSNPIDFTQFEVPYLDLTQLRKLDGDISTVQGRLSALLDERKALGLWP